MTQPEQRFDQRHMAARFQHVEGAPGDRQGKGETVGPGLDAQAADDVEQHHRGQEHGRRARHGDGGEQVLVTEEQEAQPAQQEAGHGQPPVAHGRRHHPHVGGDQLGRAGEGRIQGRHRRDHERQVEHQHGRLAQKTRQGGDHGLALALVEARVDADDAENQDPGDGNPGRVQEAFARRRPVGEKTAVHHHRIVERIAPDLQQGDGQQDPTGAARVGAGADHRRHVEFRPRHGQGQQNRQPEVKQRRLHHVRAQRRAQAAQHGIAQGQHGDSDDGERVAGGARRAEDDADDQKVGEYLAQQPHADHQVVGPTAHGPVMIGQEVLHAARPVAEADAVDDHPAGQEAQVIGGIGQGPRDPVIEAQNRSIHQRARENPGRDLGQGQGQQARRAAVVARAAEEPIGGANLGRQQETGDGDRGDGGNQVGRHGGKGLRRV